MNSTYEQKRDEIVVDLVFQTIGLDDIGTSDAIEAKAKQAIDFLVQSEVRKVLDRLEQQKTNTFIAPTHGIPLSAIEAELAALKEVKR